MTGRTPMPTEKCLEDILSILQQHDYETKDMSESPLAEAAHKRHIQALEARLDRICKAAGVQLHNQSMKGVKALKPDDLRIMRKWLKESWFDGGFGEDGGWDYAEAWAYGRPSPYGDA